jgi:hypothetical protein
VEHAAKEIWHVLCVTAPPSLPPSPHVGWSAHRRGSELFDVTAELSGLRPSVVVTLSTRLVDSGEALRLFALALAEATSGRVFLDGPIPYGLRIAGEVIPPVEAAWRTLCAAANVAAAVFQREMAAWRPGPEDDWSSL